MASTLSLYAMPGAFASTFLHFFASCSLFVHLAIYLHNQRVFLPQFTVHTETDSAKSMNGAHPLASPCPLKQLWVLTCNKNNRPGQIAAFRFSRHICIGFDSPPQSGYTDFARFSGLALPYIAKPKAPLPMQKAAWRLNQFPRKNAGKEGMHGLFSGNR